MQNVTVSREIILILVVYAVTAGVIGVLNHRRREDAQHFLHTSRDLSFWIVSLSFLAANCSALEVLTMIAVASRYGIAAVHFYWIGAIPALAFLLCVLLPRYQRLGVVRVPDYLELRFGAWARILSAGSFCLLMTAVAGITLCISSRLLNLTTGFSLSGGIWLMTFAAMAFLLAGGLSAVLYSEALQLLILLLVLVPLSAMTLKRTGGVVALVARLAPSARHSMAAVPWFAPHAPLDRLGVVVGLGVMLSFSYWCADFLLVQRLGAAKSPGEMLRTPSIAIVAKLFLPLLLVVPGLGIAALETSTPRGSLDLALPRLLLARYSNGLAALALAAIVASLFFGVCGNISAAVAIFTEDLYHLKPGLRFGNRERLSVGRVATVVMLVGAAGSAYLAFSASSLMEYIQLVLSSLNVPVAAVFLLGIFVPWFSRNSGSPGLLAGTLAGMVNWSLSRQIGYGSGLAESFYGAILAFLGTLLAMIAATLLSGPEHAVAGGRLVSPRVPRSSLALAGAALAMMIGLYYAFR